MLPDFHRQHSAITYTISFPFVFSTAPRIFKNLLSVITAHLCELRNSVFQNIYQSCGSLLEVDLFATSSNAKCQHLSLRRGYGCCPIGDALLVSWSHILLYAYSILILKALSKLKQEWALAILIALLWLKQV